MHHTVAYWREYAYAAAPLLESYNIMAVKESEELEGKVRLPVCPEAHRASIEQFLCAVEEKWQRKVSEHAAAARPGDDKRAIGVRLFLKHQLQTIQQLRYMNARRRSKNAT